MKRHLFFHVFFPGPKLVSSLHCWKGAQPALGHPKSVCHPNYRQHLSLLLKAACLWVMEREFKYEWLVGSVFWLRSCQIGDSIFHRAQLSLAYEGSTRVQSALKIWSVLSSYFRSSVLWEVWSQGGCGAPVYAGEKQVLSVIYVDGRNPVMTTLQSSVWLHAVWQHSIFSGLVGAALQRYSIVFLVWPYYGKWFH